MSSFISEKQISVKEAIPYDEFNLTPYGVLLTTSWGGHLGWFELGGSRWFTRPAANFLDLMAKTIDLSVTPIPEKNKERPEGEHLANGNTYKPSYVSTFHPMHRKLSMTIDN